MYSNKLAVAIKADGKVLREFGDQVFLPFNSEYSIFIKNKNGVRASVKIEIDGTDVTQGISLVVDPGEDFELERFIRNGNLSRGNKFKFIKRTDAIEAHRGIKVDDGLVKVTFQFERPRINRLIARRIQQDPWNSGIIYSKGSVGISGVFGSAGPQYLNSAVGTSASYSGITAPGAVSEQAFEEVDDFELDPQKHVMILRLVGEVKGKTVSSYVTTRAKTECTMCGYQSKSVANFCSQCGASLEII